MYRFQSLATKTHKRWQCVQDNQVGAVYASGYQSVLMQGQTGWHPTIGGILARKQVAKQML
jgi:hypothetical protein